MLFVWADNCIICPKRSSSIMWLKKCTMWLPSKFHHRSKHLKNLIIIDLDIFCSYPFYFDVVIEWQDICQQHDISYNTLYWSIDISAFLMSRTWKIVKSQGCYHIGNLIPYLQIVIDVFFRPFEKFELWSFEEIRSVSFEEILSVSYNNLSKVDLANF